MGRGVSLYSWSQRGREENHKGVSAVAGTGTVQSYQLDKQTAGPMISEKPILCVGKQKPHGLYQDIAFVLLSSVRDIWGMSNALLSLIWLGNPQSLFCVGQLFLGMGPTLVCG